MSFIDLFFCKELQMNSEIFEVFVIYFCWSSVILTHEDPVNALSKNMTHLSSSHLLIVFITHLIHYLLSFAINIIQCLYELIWCFDIFFCVLSCEVYVGGNDFITIVDKGFDISEICIVYSFKNDLKKVKLFLH